MEFANSTGVCCRKDPGNQEAVAAHGLKISDLGSSRGNADADPAERAQQFADAKRFVDLASALGAVRPRVRNEINGPKAEVLARIVSAGFMNWANTPGRAV